MLRIGRVPAAAFISAIGLLAACGDGGSGPDENPLEAYIGTYVLTPAPTMTCNLGAIGDATITIDTVEVVDIVGASSLELRVPARATGDAFPVQRFESEFQVSADGDGGFTGGQDLEVEVATGLVTIQGDGEMSIAGEFEDDDTFVATIDATFAVALGNGTPDYCSAISALLVTGSRVD